MTALCVGILSLSSTNVVHSSSPLPLVLLTIHKACRLGTVRAWAVVCAGRGCLIGQWCILFLFSFSPRLVCVFVWIMESCRSPFLLKNNKTSFKTNSNSSS